MTKPRFVLDTNAAIFLIAHKDIFPSVRQAVDDADVFVSVITRIELLAKPGIAPDELQAVVDFLAEVTVIPLLNLPSPGFSVQNICRGEQRWQFCLGCR